MRKESIVLSIGLKLKPKNIACGWQSGWVNEKAKTRNNKRREEDREGKITEITREKRKWRILRQRKNKREWYREEEWEETMMWSQVSTSNSMFEATIMEIYICKLVDNVFIYLFILFIIFFFLSLDSKGSREPWGSTAVRTGLCFLHIEQFLKLKEPQKWTVQSFLGQTVRSGSGFKTLNKTRQVVNIKLEIWKDALESRCSWLNRT